MKMCYNSCSYRFGFFATKIGIIKQKRVVSIFFRRKGRRAERIDMKRYVLIYFFYIIWLIYVIAQFITVCLLVKSCAYSRSITGYAMSVCVCLLRSYYLLMSYACNLPQIIRKMETRLEKSILFLQVDIAN